MFCREIKLKLLCVSVALVFPTQAFGQNWKDCGPAKKVVDTQIFQKLGSTRPGGATTSAVIRGGKFQDISKMPGLVNLRMHSDVIKLPDGDVWGSVSTCAGTRISDKYIVTAAHCLNNLRVIESARPYDVLEITYGASYLDDPQRGRAFVNNVKCHGAYDSIAKTLYNDIAGIDISHSDLQDLRDSVPPVEILDLETSGVKPRSVTVTGWGNTSSTSMPSNRLKAGEMKFVWSGPSTIRVTPFPEETTSICTGDSGGPLYATDGSGKLKPIGVVSMELPRVGGVGCGDFHDAVYTNIAGYQNWLSKLP